ncbi:MAG: YeeE/YedE family protein [Burkholderiaceae bacterium]
MSEAEVAQLQTTVLIAGFLVGFALAWVMSATDFCTMGSVADIANFGDWTRMRMWVLAIAVAIAGTQALAALGLIDLARSHYLSTRLLAISNLAGGLMFGFGMVLASGCGSRTLIRAGAGNLKAWVVLIVMAVTALMTLRGLFAVVRVQTFDALAFTLPVSQDLPSLMASWLGMEAARMRWMMALPLALVLAAWALSSGQMRQPRPILGGLGIGVLVVALWWVAGHLAYIEEDPKTLEARFLGSPGNRLEGLTFVAPVATSLELLAYWSDTSRGLTLAISTVLGVLGGSLTHALVSRRFRWEGFAGVQDTAQHLVGAALMGIGGVLGLGCTVGQGLSGISTLAIGSVITLSALIGGAWLGVRYQAWRLGI